jgi:hypothetical protein
MNKEFVPYDIALELQNIGFNEPCLAGYQKTEVGSPILVIPFLRSINGNIDIDKINNFTNSYIKNRKADYYCTAPLFQQVFEFFRNTYTLKGEIVHTTSTGKYAYTIWKWNFDNHIGKHERIGVINSWFKHEDASLECIRHLIDIVKTNKLIPNYRTDEDLEMEELRKKVRETYKL